MRTTTSDQKHEKHGRHLVYSAYNRESILLWSRIFTPYHLLFKKTKVSAKNIRKYVEINKKLKVSNTKNYNFHEMENKGEMTRKYLYKVSRLSRFTEYRENWRIRSLRCHSLAEEDYRECANEVVGRLEDF